MEELIDQLVNFDLGGRANQQLYKAARAIVGGPLALAAARAFLGLKPGDVVLLTTGFPARAWISPSIGENDGPAGTAVLARAINSGYRAIPVVVTEEALQPALGTVLRAAGFSLVSLEEARRANARDSRTAVAVLQPYSCTESLAGAAAGPLLERLRPRLAVAVERPGQNRAGFFHDMRGMRLEEGVARTDLLIDRALDLGIPVVAVGDGGNEVGMGLVLDAVREFVPFGRECRCGCGGGIGARTTADILVTAAVSNWGCYAIAACLAILLRDPCLLHTPEGERRLLMAGVGAGLINSVDGSVDPGVDGLSLETNIAMVQLLHTMAMKAITGGPSPRGGEGPTIS